MGIVSLEMDDKITKMIDSHRMYHNGVKYQFNLTPCDRHQFYNSNNRLQEWHHFWDGKLKLIRHADYELTVEVSRKCRIHAHGTITFTNAYMFYIDDLHRFTNICEHGVEIDTLQPYWPEYCAKDSEQRALVPLEFHKFTSKVDKVVPKISQQISEVKKLEKRKRKARKAEVVPNDPDVGYQA